MLKLLSEHASDSDLTPKEWLAHAYNYISVVLQNSNARLAQGGAHAHAIDQSRWERKKNSQQKWRHNSHQQRMQLQTPSQPHCPQPKLSQTTPRPIRSPHNSMKDLTVGDDKVLMVEVNSLSDTSVGSGESDEGSEYRPYTQSQPSQCTNRPTRPPLRRIWCERTRDHDRKREYVGGLTQPADTTDSGSGGVSPSDRWRPPAVSVATHSLTNIGKTRGDLKDGNQHQRQSSL